MYLKFIPAFAPVYAYIADVPQRRRRSKPLSVKILGALPSTLNKAADLAYEVEQEVRSFNERDLFLRNLEVLKAIIVKLTLHLYSPF